MNDKTAKTTRGGQSDNGRAMAVWWSLWDKYRRYLQAGIVGFIFVIMAAIGLTSNEDPISGAYRSYEEQTENEELHNLISDYYTAYAAGDLDTLEMLATPISDKEKSYITFLADYVETYEVKELYTKRGTDNGSYLVSVVVDATYKELEAAAPGLDFFYVETADDGTLYINNLYSTFNTQNGELEVDPTVTALIATFEEQDDVNELRTQVQTEFNQLEIEDAAFNTYFTGTLPNAITSWAAGYKKQEEEAAAKAAEEAKKAEEAAAAEAAKRAEEEAAQEAEADDAAEAEESAQSEETVYVTERVNVRAEASENANALGKVDGGTQLTRYGRSGDWSEIDYNGTHAYIKSEFLLEAETDSGAADAAGLSLGETVRLSDSVNIRQEAGENADRIAVAYAGETVTVVMVYDTGWSRVSYNGQTGYAKTELLQ